jgi:putative restriction endonuclease
MKLFVGITDPGWFQYLKDHQADEMNFWRPRSTGNFRVLEPGELFSLSQNTPTIELLEEPFLFVTPC